MLYHARNGSVELGNAKVDFISFGSGRKNLVMIPGLGAALKTVRGSADLFAVAYRKYAKDYTVYVFGRKSPVQEGCSTRDMARDEAEAMKTMGISKASVMGVSQGGMIAQYFAIDYPEMVEKLVLAVTLSRPNSTVRSVVGRWIAMAESGDYRGIVTDTTEKSLSEEHARKYRSLYPILCRVGRPKDFSRFIIQANSCIHHDAYDELDRIKCPTLVVGGDSDRVVGKDSSKEIAERIPDARLILYHGLGHAAFQEAKDFNGRVLEFLNSDI